jgi:hypothetical protein
MTNERIIRFLLVSVFMVLAVAIGVAAALLSQNPGAGVIAGGIVMLLAFVSW